MSEITTIGLDLAKHVFQLHGADASGRAVLRKKLRRDQVLAFFSQLPSCNFQNARRRINPSETSVVSKKLLGCLAEEWLTEVEAVEK